MDLYVNNIFVNPEIHDIYIKRVGFSLIRVYRYQPFNVAVPTQEIQMNNLKWPIETMFCGLQPTYNQTLPVYTTSTITPSPTGDPDMWRDWHRFTYLTKQVARIDAQAQIPIGFNTTPQMMTVGTFNVGLTSYAPQNVAFSQYQAERISWWISTKTFTTIRINAHGIHIFAETNAEFFANYMPYQYGGYNIVTPEDDGCVMINFCLYPGTYQPSGHLNVSRAREFYFFYTSAYVTAATPANLIIIAIALNFLLISDGSAVLRYST
jgi:hypothetical protein